MSEDDLFGWIGFWKRQADEEVDIQVKCYMCGHVYKKSLGRCPVCDEKHFDSLEELDNYFLNKSLRRRRNFGKRFPRRIIRQKPNKTGALNNSERLKDYKVDVNWESTLNHFVNKVCYFSDIKDYVKETYGKSVYEKRCEG